MNDKHNGYRNLYGGFLFCSITAFLGCKRGVTPNQFKRIEIYRTQYIELNVPQELLPVKGNEAVFKKLFGDTPTGKASYGMMLQNTGTFIDVKGMSEGKSRQVIFNAKPAGNNCADRLKSLAKAMPGSETETIAGKEWLISYHPEDRSLDFHRCERGAHWYLVFQDSKAPDRLTLLNWAKPSVESSR